MLEQLFAAMGADETVEVRAISSATPPSIQRTFLSASDLIQAERSAVLLAAKYNVYFGVCTRRGKQPARAYAVWADVDNCDPEEAQAAVRSGFPLPASFVVASGHGAHFYWLLDVPTTDLATVEQTVRALAPTIGADQAVWDRTRLLRIPGTLNHKSQPPVPVQLLSAHPEYRYALTDLGGLLGLSPRMLQLILSGSAKGFRSRSERDWAVIGALVEHQLTDAGILAVFALTPVGNKVAERGGEHYLKHSIARMRAAAEKGTPDRWGVSEAEDCFSVNGRVVASFVFDPQVLLETEREDVLFGLVRASGYTWEDVALPRSAFARVDTLLRHLPRASWQWVGTDRDVRVILPYLMDKLRSQGLPKKVGVSQLGRYADVWVTADALITPDQVVERRHAPVVYLPTGRETPPHMCKVPSVTDPLAVLRALVQLLPGANTPVVMWPLIGWFFAAPFKPVLFDVLGVKFPILNLFGTRGSGKTSLIQLFLRVAGYSKPTSYDCNTTNFVLLSLLGATTSIPVALTEFRAHTLRDPYRVLRQVLLSYDGSKDLRGRADQSTVEYPMTVPLVIDGEEPLADAAARERVIAVSLHPEVIAEGTAACQSYRALRELALDEVTLFVVQHSLQADVPGLWTQATGLCDAAFPEQLPSRVRSNLAVVVLGMLYYAELAARVGVEYLITSEHVRGTLGTDEGVVSNLLELAAGRTRILADEFVEDVYVATCMANETGSAPPFVYRSAGNTLWLHFASAFSWWLQARRVRGLPVMDKTTLRQQLREREGTDRVGQYIVGYKGMTINGQTWHVLGVDTKRCREFGLDLPETVAQLPAFRLFRGGVSLTAPAAVAATAGS